MTLRCHLHCWDSLICCFFTWRMASQGLRKPRKSIINIFKGLTWHKKVSLFYLKTKNEEKIETKYCFLFFRSNTVFAIFEKNTKQIKILNSIFDNCSFMWKESFWKVKKILIFKISVIFWKWKFCQAKFADFVRNELIKI